MKKQYKVTIDIDRRIKQISAEIPRMIKLDSNKNPLYLERAKKVSWEEMSEKDRAQFPEGKQYYPERPGDKFRRPILYTMRYKEPQYVNHYINLITEFKKRGEQGILDYQEDMQKIITLAHESEKEATQKIKSAIENDDGAEYGEYPQGK